MKLKLLYLLPLFCLLLMGCDDDDNNLVTVSSTEFKDISYEGGTFEVQMTTDFRWTATCQEEWCHVSKSEGVGSRTLVVEVDANLGEARIARVVVDAEGDKRTILFSQQGLPGGQELKYKIPIIFHVIYNDPADKNQNPDSKTIYEILDKVNEFYRHAGEGSSDLNMEFVPARLDPQGNELDEPGIERVKWVTSVLNPEDVMFDQTNKYTHFIWEPNDYVNVLLYNFSNPRILGISTFPYSTKSHPLEGTEEVEDMNITLENLKYVRAVSVNSMYIYNSEDMFVQEGLVPEEMKDLMNKQNETYITLAHELGHYFGLRHTFSESQVGIQDTDYCEDTPTYDKSSPEGYDAYIGYVVQMIGANPSFAETFDWSNLFMRTGVDGEKFESHNIMDYAYCYLDQFTPQQRNRVRHVLDYSPLIPGPKHTRSFLNTRNAPSGLLDLPFEVSVCESHDAH